ncbi:MAG TPA: hypothetical protein GX525_02985, partial [Bacilli bacterium]|nr:hypothetical protein [Bacilli bacterium]
MFRSIATKISLGFAFPLLLFSILFGFMLYKVSMDIINEHVLPQFSERLNVYIDELASVVDDNLIERAKSSEEGYRELRKTLEAFQEKRHTSNTFVLFKENNQEYILAAAYLEEYKTPYPFIEEMNKAMERKIESEIYKDDFGV